MLHQCGKKVKTKGQKVLGANSNVCRSYRGITDRVGVGLPIMNRVNIDLRFSEMKRFYWIKIINTYTEREKETGKSSWKEFGKIQINKTNCSSVFVVEYIYMMHQILPSK